MKKNKKISDFESGSKPEIVMLRERIWRVEMSRSAATRFLKKHTMGIAGTVAVIVALIVVHYALVGLASTADFYPSSCLGDWENVQNALGKPDVAPGAPASAFTTLNSAVFGTSTAQMFCGNFAGDTDISTLTGKSFQEADLVLSWSFVFPQATGTAALGSDDGGAGIVGAAGTVSSSDSDASTTTDTDNVSSTDVASSTSVSSTSASSTQFDANTSTDAGTATSSASSVSSTSSTTTDSAASDVSSTDAQDAAPPTSDTTSASTSVQTPPDASSDNDSASPPPPAPDPTNSDAPTTSWLGNLIGVAYADETSSLAIDTSTAGSTDSSTLFTVTSTAQEGTPSEPTSTPIDVNTSAFQNIAVPSSTGDAVLAIVYSTDGVTWQPLATINSSNWQQARYQIPIHSWAELEHLQVAFVGLGASSSPQIFLDAAGVEVSYADAPDDTTNNASASDTIPAVPDAAMAAPVVPPPPTELPPVQALKQVFDPFAGQQCSVAPFSETVLAGGGGSFILKLTPPASGTSSRNTAHSSFLYDVSLGSLPDGISARIVPGSPGVDTIGISTAANVAPGSYNVVVVYKERQRDGTIAPNFCQFNLVITGSSS